MLLQQTPRGGRTPLHGRRRETAILDAALRAVAFEARGGVIAIKGEHGSGRSKLLDAVAERARRDGTSFLRATALAGGRGTPLRPLLDALGETGLTPEAVQDRLERMTARRPVVLAIDDLHEADDATMQALRALTERTSGRRLLWLLALAPGRADMTASAVMRAGAGVTVRLGPLDREAVAALARDVLGAPPSTAVLDLVGDLGGHPGSIVELLKALMEERVIEVVADSARMTGQGLRHVLCDLGVRRPPAQLGPAGHTRLTRSELAVVRLVARGATNRQAAEQLFLSPHTVSTHLRHAFEKLGIRSRVELALLFADSITAA